MLRYTTCLLTATFILLISACKKDLLQLQKVTKLNSNTDCRLNHIRFINDSVCLVSGGIMFQKAEVIRSVDGGYTWSANSYPEAGKEMIGLTISPTGKIYMCGTDGTVLHSTDNGLSWQFNRILTWELYVSLAYPTPDTGILLNTMVQEMGSIELVDSSYNVINRKDFKFGLNEIYMTAPSTGYVIGYGAVLKTTDHAQTWNYLDVTGDNFMSMDIHGQEIWMCGYNGGIYHTSNGGKNWTRYRNGNDISLPRYRLLSILFTDEQNGWAVGEEGKVIHSDDGGQHWAEYKQFTTSALRSIALSPNGDLLVAGEDGALYRITP